MFRINDIAKVLESIQDDNDAVLIGGQALNLWAEYYAQQDPSLNTHSPFFSHDIDFLGDKGMAAAMHKIWKGEIRVPDMDTHTPMSANLRFNLEDGRPINIDFLEIMIGVDNYNIRKDAQRTRNPNTQKSVLVLHPAHCLASRIYNTYGILNRRSGQPDGRSADRTRLAVKVLNHALTELFRNQDRESHRQAYGFIEYTASLAVEDPAKRAYHLDDIDVLDAIPTDPNLGMTEDFLNERYPRIQSFVASKRDIFSRNFEKMEQHKVSAPDHESSQ